MKQGNKMKAVVDPREIPAPMSNEVNFMISDDGIRITFGERNTPTEDPVYHTAIFLPHRCGASLVTFLNQNYGANAEEIAARLAEHHQQAEAARGQKKN